jgi:hypothetical protein
MADINKQDPKFMDFLFGGLDHGINSISDSGGPLIPFVMTQTGEKKELQRFVSEKYEEGILMAEKHIKSQSPKPDYALIAYDGYITWENKKYDAILVRAFDMGQDEGFIFSQRYVPKTTGEGIEPIGNSAFPGPEFNLLVESDKDLNNKSDSSSKKPWWKF